MSKFEVISGVEGYCLVLDDTRIAGSKPWGGGYVIHTWETDKTYTPERTCREKHLAYLTVGCSECGVEWREDDYKYCPNCGARVMSDEELGHMVADAIRRLEKVTKR